MNWPFVVDVARAPKLVAIKILQDEIIIGEDFTHSRADSLAPKSPSLGIPNGRVAQSHVAVPLHLKNAVREGQLLQQCVNVLRNRILFPDLSAGFALLDIHLVKLLPQRRAGRVVSRVSGDGPRQAPVARVARWRGS